MPCCARDFPGGAPRLPITPELADIIRCTVPQFECDLVARCVQRRILAFVIGLRGCEEGGNCLVKDGACLGDRNPGSVAGGWLGCECVIDPRPDQTFAAVLQDIVKIAAVVATFGPRRSYPNIRASLPPAREGAGQCLVGR